MSFGQFSLFEGQFITRAHASWAGRVLKLGPDGPLRSEAGRVLAHYGHQQRRN